MDAKTGRRLHSTTLGGLGIKAYTYFLTHNNIIDLDQTISCMSGTKGEFLIGTTGGDVITYYEDDLTQIDRFTNV